MDWNKLTRSYIVWDDIQIKGFFGDGENEYRWLSNFYNSTVWFEGLQYPSVECAYQASKVDEDNRKIFTTCTSAESKKLWKTFPSIYTKESWDLVKFDIMSGIIFNKFLRNKGLRQKLIETGDKYLEETNHWRDQFWGVDSKTGIGENNLGKILMRNRMYWRI